jgi:hypothetical protein
VTKIVWEILDECMTRQQEEEEENVRNEGPVFGFKVAIVHIRIEV